MWNAFNVFRTFECISSQDLGRCPELVVPASGGKSSMTHFKNCVIEAPVHVSTACVSY